MLRIINEPTSAALAYHLGKEGEATILVFDLGGGTADFAAGKWATAVEVKATSGDSHLGGDDWDQRITWTGWCRVQERLRRGPVQGQDGAAAAARSRKAKIELSGSAGNHDQPAYITHSEQGPLHLDTKLTRAEFQKMTSDLLDRTQGPFQQVIKDGNTKLSDIQHVVLVGGSTRMPAVVDLVEGARWQGAEQGHPAGRGRRRGRRAAGRRAQGRESRTSLLLDVTPAVRPGHQRDPRVAISHQAHRAQHFPPSRPSVSEIFRPRPTTTSRTRADPGVPG